MIKLMLLTLILLIIYKIKKLMNTVKIIGRILGRTTLSCASFFFQTKANVLLQKTKKTVPWRTAYKKDENLKANLASK